MTGVVRVGDRAGEDNGSGSALTLQAGDRSTAGQRSIGVGHHRRHWRDDRWAGAHLGSAKAVLALM